MICFELRHGAHGADQDHVLAGRGVHSRGQEVRGGQDHRGCGLHVPEAGAVGAADVALVRGDPTDVVGMLPDEIGVQRDQHPSHLQGVFLVHADDDGLCEAFGLLEEVGEVASDRLRPRLQGHQALEIAGVILGIRCSLITWGALSHPAAWRRGTTSRRQVSASAMSRRHRIRGTDGSPQFCQFFADVVSGLGHLLGDARLAPEFSFQCRHHR